jgi:hypothetical protein
MVIFRDLEGRYAIAAETRNNLVAAAQNVSGAQRYLVNVQFPYCAPPEVETLNKVRCNNAIKVECVQAAMSSSKSTESN